MELRKSKGIVVIFERICVYVFVYREDTDQYGFKHSMCKDETMVETMVNRLLQQSKQLEVKKLMKYTRMKKPCQNSFIKNNFV